MARRLSLFTRLFLGNLLLMAVIILVAGLVSYYALEGQYRQDMRAQHDHMLGLLQRQIQDDWPMPPEQLDALCKRYLGGAHVRLTIVDLDGRVLGDSSEDVRHMVNHRTPDRPEIISALEGRDGEALHFSETQGIQNRYLARPVMHEGRVVAVRLAMPVKEIVTARSFVVHALLWAGLAAALTAVALGLLISWLWYAPLRRVAATARQIASGRLAVRAQLGGEDELGQLGQALNDMRENLARQIATVEGQRQTLDTVLASLRDGVLAMDAADRVVFMNQAARELLGVGAEEPIGRPLRELVGRLDIVDLYHQAGERPVSRQVEGDGGGARRTLEVQAARLEGKSQAIRGLIVARDVTEAARSAGMKAEFVANASHELRTPLAAIRAAVDSLLELAGAGPAPARDAVASPAAQAKLLAILDRHVGRLQAMTNDLLDLHVVEAGRVRLKLDDVRLDQLAEWARGQFAARAQEKSLRYEVTVQAADQAFRSDRKLLQLIVQNLLDNAIKFTPAGGLVRCELSGGQEGLTIRVSDTGCGIRPEDQPKVFDRFFQADAARSGDHRVRGTGLGLAIVKHAAERLGAKVSLASEVGKGTTVTISLQCLRAGHV